MSEASLVADDEALARLVARLSREPRIALDLEANGLFAHRARVCVVQLAAEGAREVHVVDGLATRASLLASLVEETGPTKVVHDVSFDARLLAEAGLVLGRVEDTSIAAQFLGRTKLGLASLLQAELGIAIDKSLQQHDWAVRPFTDVQLRYLTEDVRSLTALADALFTEARGKGPGGIEQEILEETRYRLRGAVRAVAQPDPRPAYTRLREIDKAKRVTRAILRRLWLLRDEAAAKADVPAHHVMSNETLWSIARREPVSREGLASVRGLQSGRAAPLAAAIVRAVAEALDEGDVPEADRPYFERPRVPPEVAAARRAREARLMAWRKSEAARRDVNEQVVLPGHCVKDIAERERLGAEEVCAIDGFGACRAPYVDVILTALAGTAPAALPGEHAREDEGPRGDE